MFIITKLFKRVRCKNLPTIKSAYLISSCRNYRSFFNKKIKPTATCVTTTTTHVTTTEFELKIEKVNILDRR
jgi:hypothetical protein